MVNLRIKIFLRKQEVEHAQSYNSSLVITYTDSDWPVTVIL
jgi:hypothetical protein